MGSTEGIDTIHLDRVGWLQFPEGDSVLRFLREGWFEYRERAFMAAYMRPGCNFLDIGAHVGVHAAFAERLVGKRGNVAVVEPNRNLLPHLQTNLATSTAIIDKAVGASDSTAALINFEDASYGHLTNQESITAPHQIVDVVGMQTLLTDLNMEPDLIKIDIEGAEFDLFKGNKQFFTDSSVTILVEFADQNLKREGHNTRELQQLIERTGYLLCEFSAEQNKLSPMQLSHPVWYANVILTKDLGATNRHLRQASTEQRKITLDLWRKGVASTRLYDASEQLGKERSRLQASSENLATTLASFDNSAVEKNKFSNDYALLDALIGRNARIVDHLDNRLTAQRRTVDELRSRDQEWIRLGRSYLSRMRSVGNILETGKPGRREKTPSVSTELKTLLNEELGRLHSISEILTEKIAETNVTAVSHDHISGAINAFSQVNVRETGIHSNMLHSFVDSLQADLVPSVETFTLDHIIERLKAIDFYIEDLEVSRERLTKDLDAIVVKLTAFAETDVNDLTFSNEMLIRFVRDIQEDMDPTADRFTMENLIDRLHSVDDYIDQLEDERSASNELIDELSGELTSARKITRAFELFINNDVVPNLHTPMINDFLKALRIDFQTDPEIFTTDHLIHRLEAVDTYITELENERSHLYERISVVAEQARFPHAIVNNLSLFTSDDLQNAELTHDIVRQFATGLAADLTPEEELFNTHHIATRLEHIDSHIIDLESQITQLGNMARLLSKETQALRTSIPREQILSLDVRIDQIIALSDESLASDAEVSVSTHYTLQRRNRELAPRLSELARGIAELKRSRAIKMCKAMNLKTGGQVDWLERIIETI